MNNNYLPINKFFARSEEETTIVKKYSKVSEVANAVVIGVSRKIKGEEIKKFLINDEKIVYSFYNDKSKKRLYYEANSYNRYNNIKEYKTYQIEINFLNDSFIIYCVD